tara:strand:- start:566 stop:1738 length:1173 start_codon:yes stop_codon:yes gene_type:complete
MAKISDQTSYPAITPVGGDYLILTDISDTNKTKTVTVQSLSDFVAAITTITSANTAITVSGTTSITLTSTAYGGGATIGHVPSGGAVHNFLQGDGTWSTIDLATSDVVNVLRPLNGGTGLSSYNAAGSLIVSTSSSVLGELEIGTAGQVLKVNSLANGLEWGADTGAVTGYTNGTDNNILTSSGATTINGESNFTFTGSDLALSGQFVATAGVGTNTAIRGIASNSTSTQGWNTSLGVANFDQNDTGAFCTTIAVNTESTNGKLISFYYQENSGTGPKGEIKYDTASSQVQYNVTSDYRLKENILDLSSAVDRVKNLKPKRFNFIGNENVIDGFLAHEVQEVVPEAVSGSKDQVFEDGQVNPQQMDASKLIPVLTAAIKELTARIEALEA